MNDTWGHLVLAVSDAAEAQRVLDEHGRSGWELASAVAAPETGLLLFLKRRAVVDANPAPAADAAAQPTSEGEPAVQQRTFEVVLTGVAGDKAAATLALTQKCPWLHLRDAKKLVDAPPGLIRGETGEDEALGLQQDLAAVGLTVEVRESQ